VIDSARESDPVHLDQHGGTGGHLPPTSHNVQLVGKLRVHDAARGIVADVGELGNFAYLAQFSPGCTADGAGGAYVVDIADPANPREVGFIPAHQGSFVGEGVHAIHIDTPSFAGDILALNNEICGAGGLGGVSLWDITNPLAPVALAQNFGDTTDALGNTVPVRQYHSVFAWQQDGRAFVVASDDEEQAQTDVDIMEITDPRNPRLIAETGLRDWPAAKAPLANGDTVFNHDMVVRKIGSTWTMLSSYWDAGYVKLNVDDPAHPKFINDSDFTDPDPISGFSPPEGNGHYAEFDRKGRFIIGTDEDFSPFRTAFQLTTGPNAGPSPGGRVRLVQADRDAAGPEAERPDGVRRLRLQRRPGRHPTTLGAGPARTGRGGHRYLPARAGAGPQPPARRVPLRREGPERRRQGLRRVIIANHHSGAGGGDFPDAFTCGGGDPRPIPAICIGHRAFHLMFNRTPGYTIPYPVGDPGDLEPNPGDLGPKVAAETKFDGWGYIHLFDASTLRELDTYAIPEEEDPAFATGFGNLTIHEVTFDPTADLAYLSWYAGGFRVVSFGPGSLTEVGRFIDQGGNDFWGVQIHKTADGERLILASDRDSGLYVFRYTGQRP
jgi:hypothetical protein